MARPVKSSDADIPDDPYDDKRYFMYGFNYLSDNVYMGRKDSTHAPYYSPYIRYHLANGLYAKTIVSYAANKRRVDLLTLSAGYDHTFGERLNAGADIDKYFYNKNSDIIRGDMKVGAGVYGQYANDWVEPMICFDVNRSKKNDYILGIVADHDFRLLEKTLNIIPAITFNSGTQHFYDDYFLSRLLKNDKNLKIAKVLANANRFKTLDYELSAKVTYRTGKWLFTALPVYAIPLSPNTLIFPKTTYTEKLVNSFYLELDVCHR